MYCEFLEKGGGALESKILGEEAVALPFSLARLLPSSVTRALANFSEIEELRLSVGRSAFVRKDGKNYALDLRLSAKEMEDLVFRLSGNSLYAHTRELCEGYLSVGEGVRVGVGGRVVLEEGRVVGLSEITSLCFRIPHRLTVDVSEALSLLREFSFVRGILVYAPPAGGKTTYLRSLARALASGDMPRRVAVIDTRDELAYSLESPTLCLDLLSGYPKGYGIEVATRTLGAQVILCDEIGSEEDARAILSVQSGGVPLCASAHAASVRDLLSRPPLLSLHRAGVFGAYLGLCRGERPRLTYAWEAEGDV